ncbi:HD domain-containing protein [Deinococcus sp. MIMF12]|uniref:HD domain-containing protein n=1 Tax=Deinococcus rhizophilus TaxID=3049544 RepID=A0ABT7JNP8_9DEIO|nr:HD domain-containing protein [Deinococcus rhizophilus]MDL2345533.1 HD domain-containing protein [Deinococcus rhizophilus]
MTPLDSRPADPYAAIKAELIGQFALGPGSLHGPDHWQRVEETAVRLAQAEGGDVAVARWFGLFHDAARRDEGADLLHGRRAARLVGRYQARLGLTDAQLERLKWACEHHVSGQTTDDPTVGACWDADRLDLPRVGIQPQARYLSTAAGRARAVRLAQAPAEGRSTTS